MNFEYELKKGNMLISECNKCKKITWPPSEFCNQCLGATSWRKCSKQGKIIEFSKQKNTYFGIAEFEGCFRIMGEILIGIPSIGDSVEIIKCGINDGNYLFQLKVIK